MKRRFDDTPASISDLLHPAIVRILPKSERERFLQLCNQKRCLRYPPLKLSACQRVNTIMSPTADILHEQWSYEERMDAETCFKQCDGNFPSVLHVRATLVGHLTSSSNGALYIRDTATAVPIVIAPPPPPSTRDSIVYASNWRYIPKRGGSKGYFEVLFTDLVSLTPLNARNWKHVTTPASSPTPLVCLCARITAKSCRIAMRKRSSCFLVELSGKSDATIVVFRGDAVAWWPFLRVGSEVILRGLRLCSLPSYSRRTVFLASSRTMSVVESISIDTAVVKGDSTSLKHPRVPKLISEHSAYHHRLFQEHALDYEGLITEVLVDGRFQLDDRVTFHPGPIHSFGSNMIGFLNLRKGTRIKVYNAHLVQWCEDVRLFPTAKTSIDVLYFGELKTIHDSSDTANWRQSTWDLLWKRLDVEDVLWAEEMYDMLATKFWHWLNGSAQPESEGTDRDRVGCLLGDQNEVGLVQYVMHLLSGREDLLDQKSSSRRDVYKEFLDPPAPGRVASQITFVNIPTLQRLKEMVLVSQVSRVKSSNESSPNRADLISVLYDVVMLHHSRIMFTEKQLSRREAREARWQLRPALSGLLHTLKSVRNRLAISDASSTLPVRIVGQFEPALIGAIVLVTDYYLVVHFREGEHESVTAVFAAESVKTIVDGPYAELGHSVASGPLICETQSYNQTNKNVRSRQARHCGLRNESIVLTRRTWAQSASGQSSQEKGFVRIADVPLISMFVETVKFRNDKMELSGKLVAIRRSQRDEAWEIILRDEKAGIFWDCKLVLSGDSAMELAPVFQENQLWSVSCSELGGERDARSYIRKKGTHDGRFEIALSSTFNRIVPWVENLGKGEYMRYVYDEDLSDCYGVDNFSELSREGWPYSLVRDAVESFSVAAAARVTTSLWEVYNGIVSDTGDVVHIRGIVTHNSVWDMSSYGQGTEWILTVRDDDIGMFAIPIEFRKRRDSLAGLAPGMRVVIHNIHRERKLQWARCKFKAGVDTTVRCVSIADSLTALRQNSPRSDYELLKRLPRINLVDFERSSCKNWVGVLRFDILKVLEIRLCARRHNHHADRESVEMGVTVLVEDGTTKGRLRCEGFENCCSILGLSQRAREGVIEVARGRGTVTITAFGGAELGLEGLFLKRLEWCSLTGAVVCEQRSTGQEVIMKCFNLGFGSRAWTACREDVVAVECVALLGTGAAALRARVCTIEDGLNG